MTTVRPLRERIIHFLDEVEDPEIPVTLVDLGVLREIEISDATVSVTMIPTRLGCPARGEMERRVRAAVATAVLGLDTEVEVVVRWNLSRWASDDVTPAGRAALREAGYTVGGIGPNTCPYCSATEVRRAGEFGGAVCKVPYTCGACGSTFDALASAALPVVP